MRFRAVLLIAISLRIDAPESETFALVLGRRGAIGIKNVSFVQDRVDDFLKPAWLCSGCNGLLVRGRRSRGKILIEQVSERCIHAVTSFGSGCAVASRRSMVRS